MNFRHTCINFHACYCLCAFTHACFIEQIDLRYLVAGNPVASEETPDVLSCTQARRYLLRVTHLSEKGRHNRVLLPSSMHIYHAYVRMRNGRWGITLKTANHCCQRYITVFSRICLRPTAHKYLDTNITNIYHEYAYASVMVDGESH